MADDRPRPDPDANPRAVIRALLKHTVLYAREKIPTAPDHALFPNHRADETVRDLLEEVIYSGD